MRIYNTTTKRYVDLLIRDYMSGMEITAELLSFQNIETYNLENNRREMNQTEIARWEMIAKQFNTMYEHILEAKDIIPQEELEDLFFVLENKSNVYDLDSHIQTISKIIDETINKYKTFNI